MKKLKEQINKLIKESPNNSVNNKTLEFLKEVIEEMDYHQEQIKTLRDVLFEAGIYRGE